MQKDATIFCGVSKPK